MNAVLPLIDERFNKSHFDKLNLWCKVSAFEHTDSSKTAQSI